LRWRGFDDIDKLKPRGQTKFEGVLRKPSII
jgi:hypothetical protein